MSDTLMALPLAIVLTLGSPALAAAAAFYSFKHKTWRSYRIYARASCFSSIFCLAVIAYVAFLGRGAAINERFERISLGTQAGGLPVLALTVAVVASILGGMLAVRRTDDGRGDNDQIGRPMLAVFAILLLAILGVSLFSIQLRITAGA